MKNFIYFENREGVMEVHEGIRNKDELSFLAGWMDEMCKTGDTIKVDAMESALVGQKYNHRLGCLVRMMDT